jgi:hypothetical protein
MRKLSLSTAWEESREVLRHDGRLLAIVALALIAFPSTIQAILTPPAPQGELPPPGPWMIVAAVAILIGIVGQIAIVRLAVGPHTTVGEAIGHGARRMPAYFAAVLIWVMPLAIAIVVLISTWGEKPTGVRALLFILIMVIGIFFVIRLIMMPAVASTDRYGPIGILNRSWALTRGYWWRLFAFLAAFVVGALCAIIAVEAVVGTIVTLILGTPEPMSVGTLIIVLVTQLIIAAISVVYFVMVARIYVQLAGGAEAEVGVPTSGI